MDPDTLKQRDLVFCALHPDPAQAHSAARLLSTQPGVEHVEAHSATLLRVRYDVREVCLEALEQLLEAHGLHLENSLLLRLKRALIHYSEDAQRANLAHEDDPARLVFMRRYQRLRHGCRDQRPDHWRHYL